MIAATGGNGGKGGSSSGNGGNGGNANVTLKAGGSISTGTVTATGGNGGSGSSSGGNGGNANVSVSAGTSISTGVVIATGGDGGGGRNSIGGAGGSANVSLTAGGGITTGAIGATGGNGANSAAGGGASIFVKSGGAITTGAIAARGGAGSGSGSGFVTLNGKTGITVGGGIVTTGSGGSVTLLFNGGTATVGGTITTPTVRLFGDSGAVRTGTGSVVTDASNINVGGGKSIQVASVHNGLVSVGSSGSGLGGLGVSATGALTAASLNLSGALALITPGPLSLTGTTLGTTTLLQTDVLGTISGNHAATGSTLQLAPFTPSLIAGVNSNHAPPALVQTQIDYLPGLLNSFGTGLNLIIGGAVGGVETTGNIHVGADGGFNIGSDNITFSTAGLVIFYPIGSGPRSVVTTTGSITVSRRGRVAAAAAAGRAAGQAAQHHRQPGQGWRRRPDHRLRQHATAGIYGAGRKPIGRRTTAPADAA